MDQQTRARTRSIQALLDLIWSRPVVVVIALSGLLLVWGAFSRRSSRVDNPTA